ncbi:Gfo/Idh/MocA family protein [Pontiella sulfatireligans]|uniref:Inositol 2-dehydrogenase n=1 Tax=Pontiella sulfatireligans TaxID=2750658 RepID=A0A6C2UGF5_9BACT|nr:Gfo/Idh/MocA family oxidoreductase [Pontiella sulfatireligans]VGO19292.1 Inositol 2-dehydrogenase [Pontiella sulfatireligans]
MKISRRQTLMTASAAATYSLIPGKVLGANNQINLAAIGIGQQGGNILRAIGGQPGVNVVALCDVDIDSDSPVVPKGVEKYSVQGWMSEGATPATAASKFPNAKKYRDFRKMFDEMGDEIDAVCIGVPDHSHFPIAMAAMMLGKPVYVEKPLARTFQECQLLMDAEQKYGVVTQMGNQGHSGDNYHQFKLWKETGIIKNVTHVDAQMNSSRRWHPWGEIAGFPASETIPPGMNWPVWQGTTPMHVDFNKRLHYGNWRGWHQFGTGCFGDWGAHILDTIHEFLDLGLPEKFSAKKLVGRNDYVFPLQSTINFAFPERNGMPAMDIDWYDGQGNYAPTPKEMGNKKFRGNGKVIYSEDLVFQGSTHGRPLQIVPYDKFKQMLIDGKVSKDYGKHSDHHANFINAVRGDEKTRSPFSVSGPLCQMFALGCIAQRLGGEYEFDRKTKRITNDQLANSYLMDDVRQGWEQYYKI